MTKNAINKLITEWLSVERNSRVNKFTKQEARKEINKLLEARSSL